MAGSWDKLALWIAAIIGGITEMILIWLVDRLPLRAQLIVYGIPVVAVIAGFFLVWRERRKPRAFSLGFPSNRRARRS